MRPLISTVLLVAALTLSGCGSADPSSTGSESGTGAQADLSFTGTTLSGETFEGADLQGKPAVLWFWAPWCPTCLAQSPNVAALGKQYAGKISVVAVSGLATEEMIEEMAPRISDVVHVVDVEGTIWNHFRVAAQSTYTVIDADGTIVSEGYLDDADLNRLVADLAD